MKKFLSLALALTMALTLAACGGKTDTPPADTNDGSTAGQTGGKLVCRQRWPIQRRTFW